MIPNLTFFFLFLVYLYCTHVIYRFMRPDERRWETDVAWNRNFHVSPAGEIQQERRGGGHDIALFLYPSRHQRISLKRSFPSKREFYLNEKF